MKVSKYTFLFDMDSVKFYIYNTLSNALIEIDEDSYQYLIEAKKVRSSVVTTKIGNKLYELLVERKFIVENDLDSYLFYKSIVIKQRACNSHMHLTIAPTMDCCFTCHYCFEKYKTKKYLSEDVMDNIIGYLKSLDSKPDFKLTWFGGEPLMALSKIENFY